MNFFKGTPILRMCGLSGLSPTSVASENIHTAPGQPLTLSFSPKLSLVLIQVCFWRGAPFSFSGEQGFLRLIVVSAVPPKEGFSTDFRDFVRMCVQKDPQNRPTADQMVCLFVLCCIYVLVLMCCLSTKTNSLSPASTSLYPQQRLRSPGSHRQPVAFFRFSSRSFPSHFFVTPHNSCGREPPHFFSKYGTECRGLKCLCCAGGVAVPVPRLSDHRISPVVASGEFHSLRESFKRSSGGAAVQIDRFGTTSSPQLECKVCTRV